MAKGTDRCKRFAVTRPPLSPVAVTVYPAAGTGNTAALRAASLSAQKAARPPVCKDAPLIRCQAAV